MRVHRALLTVALGISLLVAAGTPARAEDPPAHALIQVFLTDLDRQVEELNRCGYDIAHVDRVHGTVDLVVNARDMDEILSAGYSYVVLQVSRRAAGLFGARTAGAEQVEVDSLYKDYNEIYTILRTAEQTYPTIAKRYLIGGTNFPRAIYAMKISDNVATDEDEPTVLFNGQHHAREVMSTEVVLDILEYLTTRYATDANVQRWVNGREIWLVPSVNPDGNMVVFTVDDFWRKNIRDNDGSGNFTASDGVDINRNYPFQWGGACNGSSSDITDETYRGPYSGSEPETQAIMKLEREQHPIFAIDYHSYAEELYYAYGCEPSISPSLSTISPPVPDQSISRVIGEDVASRLIQADGGLGYPASPNAYGIDGNSRDNQFYEVGTIAFVIELNTAAEGGFQPGYTAWRNATVQGQRPGWQFLLDRVDGPSIHGHVTDARSGQPLMAEVSLDELTVSNGEVYYAEPRYGRYHFITVPGTYHVHARAAGYDERVATVTVGATAVTLDLALTATGSVLFRDDFEGAITWTVGGAGDDATQGQWVKGDPNASRSGTYPGSVTYAAPEFDRSVQNGAFAYLTGNPQNPSFGAGDVDTGVTSLVSPVFDASGFFDVVASYERRFFKQGTDPQDLFTAEVSNDGGLSWVQLEQLTSSTTSATQSPAWRGTAFRLDSRLPLTSNMKLRFRTSDRAPDNTIEGGVDDVVITGTQRLTVSGAALTVVSFAAVPGATSYDVIRGLVGQLQELPDRIDLGQVACIENNSTNPTTAEAPDATLPGDGECFFYLVRVNMGAYAGSYGKGSSGLERVPDPLSPLNCP